MNSDTEITEENAFSGLVTSLEGWFDKAFEDLPKEKRDIVVNSGLKIYWNALDPDERQDQARRKEIQHDPATEDERKHVRDLCGKLYELEIGLKEWQTIPALGAVGLETQKRNVRECQEEISRIKSLLNEPCNQGVAVDAAADQAEAVAEGGSSVLRRGMKIYKGQREITDAYNQIARANIKWAGVRARKNKGLKIINDKNGLKDLPTLDHVDLLDHLGLLPPEE